jgi:hypothetical protein
MSLADVIPERPLSDEDWLIFKENTYRDYAKSKEDTVRYHSSLYLHRQRIE